MPKSEFGFVNDARQELATLNKIGKALKGLPPQIAFNVLGRVMFDLQQKQQEAAKQNQPAAGRSPMSALPVEPE